MLRKVSKKTNIQRGQTINVFVQSEMQFFTLSNVNEKYKHKDHQVMEEAFAISSPKFYFQYYWLERRSCSRFLHQLVSFAATHPDTNVRGKLSSSTRQMQKRYIP